MGMFNMKRQADTVGSIKLSSSGRKWTLIDFLNPPIGGTLNPVTNVKRVLDLVPAQNSLFASSTSSRYS